MFIRIALVTVALISSVMLPEFIAEIRYPILAAVLLFIGIPHGAMDHVVDAAIENWDSSKLFVPFYAWYLSAIAIYIVGWLLFPTFSFVMFLVITAYHFGQADTQYLGLSKNYSRVLSLLRGLMIAAFLMFSDAAFTSSIISYILPIDWLSIYQQLPVFPYEWVLPVIYVFVLIVSKRYFKLKILMKEMMDVLLISLLFNKADIVLAFSLYFGFWHSYEHVKRMAVFLKEKGREKLNLKSFYQQALNFSLLIYLATLFLYNMLSAFGEAEKMIALFLVIISVLTLPHLFVVEKMYTHNH